jgi:predicted metal-dependent hydrolase
VQKAVNQFHININNKAVLVEVHREMRRNTRASVVGKGILIRLPLLLSPSQQEREVEKLLDWAKTQLEKNEKLQKRVIGRHYNNEDTLSVGQRSYTISIDYEDRASHTARIDKGYIRVKLAKDASAHSSQKAIRHLLSRCIASDFMPHITRRVQELNHLHFRKDIKSIQLKYNHSNWGSCSSSGNINLSTRLLFAPDDVVDYVIIHELAHLVELNHSDRFWKVVSDVMPDYEEKEKWLKNHGAECDF